MCPLRSTRTAVLTAAALACGGLPVAQAPSPAAAAATHGVPAPRVAGAEPATPPAQERVPLRAPRPARAAGPRTFEGVHIVGGANTVESARSSASRSGQPRSGGEEVDQPSRVRRREAGGRSRGRWLSRPGAGDDGSGLFAGDAWEALAAEWEALAQRTGAAPWLHPGWFAAWQTAFGRGDVRLETVRDGARLVAVAPMEERRRRLFGMANWHTPSFGVIAEPGRIREAAERMLQERPHRITLAFVTEGDEALNACRDAFEKAGYSILVRTLERSPYVDLSGGWSQYEQGLGAKRRAELRRRLRRLEELGTVEFAIERGSSRLDDLLDEGFDVEASSWKGRKGTAIASRPETAAFYRTVAHWAAAHGWLRLAYLRVDSRPIAFDFAFETDSAHYLLKTGFDEDYRRFAPGLLLRHHMLEHAFSQGLQTYEFLADAEEWKLDWTPAARSRMLLQAFSPSIAGRADALAYRYGRPLAKRLLAAVGR